jgi:superfamily II DNA/RNA helicase
MNTFINQLKNWKDLNLPENILHGVLGHGFSKPSEIQAVSVPLICERPTVDLIIQSKNGTGKSGSFAIGTLNKIEQDLPKI